MTDIIGFDIAVTQPAGRSRTACRDIVVDPERKGWPKTAGPDYRECVGCEEVGTRREPDCQRDFAVVLSEAGIAEGDRQIARQLTGVERAGECFFLCFCAEKNGRLFTKVSSSFGNLNPFFLNATPKSLSSGKLLWHVVQDVWYLRENAGIAFARGALANP